MSVCRSCHAPVLWVTMAESGKASPLDAEPSEKGNIEVATEEGQLVGRVVTGNGERLFPVALYLSHFATCEQSAEWRRK